MYRIDAVFPSQRNGRALKLACLFVFLAGLANDSSVLNAQTYQAPTYFSGAPASSVATTSAAYAPMNLAPPIAGAPTGFPVPIEQAAYAPGRHKPNKPLPHQIVKMPQVEEELEVIHHRSQLILTRSRIARWSVSDPSIVDVLTYGPTEIAVIGLQLGTTHLHLWFEGEEAEPLIYRVEVIRDPNLEDRRREDYGKLERQLRVLFPNSQVFLIPLTRRVIVKGQARDQEEAARIMDVVRAEWMSRNADWYGTGADYGGGAGGGFGGPGGTWDWNAGGFGNGWNNNQFVINMLEIPGEQQVMVHVKIARISRSQERKLGVNIAGIINDKLDLAIAASGAGAAGAAAGGTIRGVLENGEVSVILDWLARHKTAKILAEPSLTVLSGHNASFISGGEFAVPTIVGIGGAQGTTTTFRGYGVSLIVTPTIIDKDLIRMRVVPEFSSIDRTTTVGGAGGIPGLTSHRATTTVQLREGQTLALAGLFGHTSETAVNRIPFLGELPWIGPRLFNDKSADMGENELLFLVTPEIVRPMEQDEVPPVPGFYVTHPNDYELYHYAMTEGAPDEGVYQLAPYGWGPGMGTEIGYRPYNPELNGPFPPGPPNGVIGGSMQTGMGGGYGFPAGAMPSGGYSTPTPAMPAPSGTPAPIPDPSVRFNPNRNNSALLSRQSADEVTNSQKRSWNPFKAGGNVQPAGYGTSRQPQGVQPADYQTPRGTNGRYR